MSERVKTGFSRTAAAVSAPLVWPLSRARPPGPPGRLSRRPLGGMPRAQVSGRRRALALKLVAAIAARTRTGLAALGVAAAARGPAVLAALFLPAH